MSNKIDLALPVAPDTPVRFADFMDAEKLVRLHPHWHILDLEMEGSRTKARLRDHATEKAFELDFSLAFPDDHEMQITCQNGPVQSIRFYVDQARLHLTYHPHEGQLTPEKEQDLTLWLQSIRQYMRLYLKATPFTRFFRMVMNRALLKMNPSQRKICLMLYRFTVLEIVVILLVVVGYVTFGRG